ncbi:hypothetical protein GWI33_020427 [Rhynchophorus ferrugineus]|uniref:D-isomer specific 2-hydroxyacid dehydrogenase NAD-binding domain-containing protein n=1 Tax=Rhynchophorus ferrugineus TaxID=354439 RepID=A0A834HSH8_RHYFE|nr:hypothetical protein GWI33_020427 [Rhynchophorus ferrugineus]
MSKSVAIFSRFPLASKLKESLPFIDFIDVKQTDPTPLYTAEVILADYDYVGPHLSKLQNIKWIQGTWAGIDYLKPFIQNDNPPKFLITRTSGENFGQLMGEHVLATMIFWERNYFQARENQYLKNWDKSICSEDHRSLAELTVGILGIGSIGNRIGRTLNYLGSTIYGYGRQEINLNNEEYEHISQYFTQATLKDFLANVDYVINVLPATPQTDNLLGNGILENCKGKNVIFINVGRGNIIKETELINALNQEWISGAILDVFENEPLSKDSPLWEMKNVFITPHISGNSRSRDIIKKFVMNYERYQNNQPLINIVDFDKGY